MKVKIAAGALTTAGAALAILLSLDVGAAVGDAIYEVPQAEVQLNDTQRAAWRQIVRACWPGIRTGDVQDWRCDEHKQVERCLYSQHTTVTAEEYVRLSLRGIAGEIISASGGNVTYLEVSKYKRLTRAQSEDLSDWIQTLWPAVPDGAISSVSLRRGGGLHVSGRSLVVNSASQYVADRISGVALRLVGQVR